MKIGIIGATGHVGSHLVKAALADNHDVTAIVRSPEKLQVSVPVLKKDLFALTTTDLTAFDVVIDAFNAPLGKEELHQTSLLHLAKILSGTAVWLIVVGGASSLYLSAERSKRLLDTIPANSPIYPTASNMAQALAELKKVSNSTWTYVSPAANFIYKAPYTGKYQINKDILEKDSAGKSEVSMADYAKGIMDLIKHPQKNIHISIAGDSSNYSA
ncbi:flavin reductase [Enterococcus saigonensis]|uniref:Flavin reductase n=1 Tax=Enterococcus saigonensis TaxID=1805431 RepID=A0A679ISC2_9ENTE|nr:NAD(P)H-binding protein [Enterococcus saigonensis]BCA86357.1 flavin reductase [Enterococcus saigonensis]